LNLSRLNASLTTASNDDGSVVSLVEASGTILAHTQQERVLTPMSTNNEAILRARAGEAAVLRTTNAYGEAVYAAAMPVPNAAWVVASQVPVSVAWGPLLSVLQQLPVVALGAFLLATTVGIAAAGWLAGPIERLRGAARFIGDENFNVLGIGATEWQER